MKKINSDVLKRLIRIIEKRIKSINDSIANNEQAIQRIDKYDSLIITIKEDNLCFSNPQFKDDISEIISDIKIEDKNKLEELLEKLNYLDVISSSIVGGFYKEYSNDEINIINEVIELIQYFKSLSIVQKDVHSKNVSKSTEELEKCESLYDKLRSGVDGIIHFDRDLTYLMQLISEEDVEFKKSVLMYIQELSRCIHQNIIDFVEDDKNIYDDIVEDENEEINYDVISSIFEKYGFDFNFFTDKHKNVLSRISMRRVENVLEVLCNNPEYAFVKNYQKYHKEKQLFLIIRYSTKDILEYLIKDAANRGVSVQEIFGVSGVYKKVSKNVENSEPKETIEIEDDDTRLTGTYEYYRKNAEYFEMMSLQYNADNPGANIDFFKNILLTAPEVLALPSTLLIKNIELAKLYGIKMVHKTKIGEVVPHTPTMYISRHFAELADILIENGLYDYAVNYPSILIDDRTTRKILYFKIKDKLERTSNGMIKEVRYSNEPYDLDEVVNRKNLFKYTSLIPKDIKDYIDNAEVDINSIKNGSVLDSLFDGAQMIDGVMYDIDGVKVSRYKVNRVWQLLSQCPNASSVDIRDLFMYALTYNSYYADYELDILERFGHEVDFGGVKL